MAKKPKKVKDQYDGSSSKVGPKAEIGYYGTNTRFGDLKSDEFLAELKGIGGVKRFREMRDNDATTGSAMYAIEQTLRDVGYKIKPAEGKGVNEKKAKEHAKFVEECFADMQASLDDHISEALSALTYGFSSFEIVLKKRDYHNSKFPDGKLGIKKLASRAQWTVSKFDVDDTTGDLIALHQSLGKAGYNGIIPEDRLLHYRTTTTNGDWSGRSVLRNAYKSYYYLSRMQDIEAIAIEREMHGIPVGRMPAEYLSEDASDDQKAVYQAFVKGIADIKNNEQGAIVLPSDTYEDTEGKASNIRLMDIELLSAPGSRSIDMNEVIVRYQNNIARTLMAEFLMLGGGGKEGGGSHALSTNKSDMFLSSLEAYLNTFYDTISRQLIPYLWRYNGFDPKYMPTVYANKVSPVDLVELGKFIKSVSDSGVEVANQEELIAAIFDTADLPFDTTKDMKKESPAVGDSNVSKGTAPEDEEGRKEDDK